jgi:hypothetical protein
MPAFAAVSNGLARTLAPLNSGVMNRSIMKYLLFIAFLILFNLNGLEIFSEETSKSDLIPNKFATLEELKEWTETSTFGGGNLIKLQG